MLIFPARIANIEGKPVFYLFSVRQVAEVLTHVDAHPVPFAPEFTQGVTHWRGRVLPILSLEHCLGVAPFENQKPLKPIVVRSVIKDSTGALKELYAICKVGTEVHLLDFPLDYESIPVPEEIVNRSYIYGTYKMQKGLLLVINVEKILNANIIKDA